VSLAGCNLGGCIYEQRSVATTGIVFDNGTQIASATVSELEQRDSDPDKDFIWTITSQSLAGHIQSMVLVDNMAKSVVLYTFTLTPGATLPIVSSGFVSQSDGANLNAFFDVLAHDRGLVLITTDLPGKSLIEMALTVSTKYDWHRPNCS